MGLDQYAYRLRQDLAPEAQIKVNLTVSILKHYGVEVPTEEQIEPMSDDEQQAWHRRVRATCRRAQAEGVFDSEFAYWRKFNNLHGWMEALYCEKGGEDDFNCATLRLTEADLDRLAQEVRNLAPTSGFFFGRQDPMTEDCVDEVQQFVAKAKQAIAEGYAVYYDSWW